MKTLAYCLISLLMLVSLPACGTTKATRIVRPVKTAIAKASTEVTAAQLRANAARGHVDKIVEKTAQTPELHDLALKARTELDELTKHLLEAQSALTTANTRADEAEAKVATLAGKLDAALAKLKRYAKLRLVLAGAVGFLMASWISRWTSWANWVPLPYLGIVALVLRVGVPVVASVATFFGVDFIL